MQLFKVTYKHGRGVPIIVEADTPEMAARIGLAEYRRTNGTDEMVDFNPVDKVVERVEPIFS